MTLLKFLPLFYSHFPNTIYTTLKINTISFLNLIIFQGKYSFFIIHRDNIVQALFHSNPQLFQLLKIKLDSLIFTLNYNFKKVILSKGVGYKFFLKKTKAKTSYLKIKAGYNQPIILKFLNSMFRFKIPKVTRLCVRSNNLQQLMLLTLYIKNYRKPNVYTGKGFRSRYDKRIRKEVHKSK